MQKDILRKQPSSERKLRNTSPADYRHSSFYHGDSLWSFITKVGSGSERRFVEMEQVIMMIIMIEIIVVMIVMIVGNND